MRKIGEEMIVKTVKMTIMIRYRVKISLLIDKPLMRDKRDEINGDKKMDKIAPPPVTIPISVLDKPRYCKNIAT